MIYTYEKYTSLSGENFIRRIEDGSCIPTDPANSDYQAYLASLDTPQA